jgi:hypothetical protein
MLRAAMDPPPAEHAGWPGLPRTGDLQQDLFHQVLLALERIEGLPQSRQVKLRAAVPKENAAEWSTTDQGGSPHLWTASMATDQLVQTMLRLNAGCPALNRLVCVNGASHSLVGASANLPPSLIGLSIRADMVRRKDACTSGLAHVQAPRAVELSDRTRAPEPPAGVSVGPASQPAGHGNQPDRAGHQQQAFDQHQAEFAACTNLRKLHLAECGRLKLTFYGRYGHALAVTQHHTLQACIPVRPRWCVYASLRS